MAKLVAATYGDALFEVAVEQNSVDRFYDESKAVYDAVKCNEDLIGFLSHPKIGREDKIKAIDNIFGTFVSNEMTGFLVNIVSKDRSKDIPAIMEYFGDKVKEYRKIGTAYVTTPMELDEHMKKKVENRLLQTTDYRSFDMNFSVDPGLIGGMVIRIGDRVVDSSIKSKLEKLSRELYSLDV